MGRQMRAEEKTIRKCCLIQSSWNMMTGPYSLAPLSSIEPRRLCARSGRSKKRARQDIPVPSQGETRVSLPTLTAVKVILYQGMRDQDVGKAELARRLGWHLPQVDRVLDVNHHSRLDQMDIALGAIGLRLEVTSKEAA